MNGTDINKDPLDLSNSDIFLDALNISGICSNTLIQKIVLKELKYKKGKILLDSKDSFF